MDSRDLARAMDKWYSKFDEKNMVAVIDLEEEEREIPCIFKVCPLCNGKGTHVNPSIDSHGISAEEFYEDPDFAQDYMSGMYNVLCYECGGKRVVPWPRYEEDEKLVEGIIEEELAFARMAEAERRFGC